MSAAAPVPPAADGRVGLVTRIGRWWGERSAAERFDLSARWSMYLILGLPLFLVASAVSTPEAGETVRPVVAAVLLALGMGHAVVCSLLMRAALAAYLGRPVRLRHLACLAVAVTLGVSVAGATVLSTKAAPDPLPLAVVLAVVFTAMLVAAASPAVPPGPLAGLVIGVVVLGAAITPLLGGAPVRAAVFAVIWVGFMTGTYRFSAWMVGVVWELDRARSTAARLAVAEERLRFSRDLHDVLGRNLSVIAVKSELAGRLAERGEKGAVAEMAGVRQVAHESLREVRDVVRGYRTTDLETELAGARSVLRSAGIECRVTGDAEPLPEPVQAVLGWVVREATTNVIRHSAATSCSIELGVQGDGDAAIAVLRIANDRPRRAGPGARGSGLAGLAERLAGAGGRLRADHERGDRFVVEAYVPLAAAADGTA